MQSSPCLDARHTPLFSISNGGSKEPRNEKKRFGRYCQKVATPRIDRPLSITPFSGTPTMLPRMWNRPGLRVDAPMKTEAKAFRREGSPIFSGRPAIEWPSFSRYVDLRHLGTLDGGSLILFQRHRRRRALRVVAVKSVHRLGIAAQTHHGVRLISRMLLGSIVQMEALGKALGSLLQDGCSRFPRCDVGL